jgi:nucleotide-binding universal stress UspA family protein
MVPFRIILVAADFSESSRDAFQVACSLARADEARVFVLNVMEPKYIPEAPVYFGQQSVAFQVVAREPSEHESQKARLREAYTPNVPLDVAYCTEEGNAAEEILAAAETIGCDLIAMGTHGRTGLGRVLMGSVAEEVLRGAGCPVLAVKGPRPAATAHSHLTPAAGILGNEEVKQS